MTDRRLVGILPVIEPHDAECLDTIAAPGSACGIDPADIIVVDNSRHGHLAGIAANAGFGHYRDPDGHNLGVARSWNIGARKVLVYPDIDYLVIISGSMRFGPELHTTFRRQMETFWGETVIEADGHSWHLIALHRRVLEMVGLFDENFYPAYFEQIDYGYRMRMLRLEHSFRHVWVNALSAGSAQHIDNIDCPAGPLLDYYREKWGGDKGHETFVQPWGSKPIGYFPTWSIPKLAQKYRLKRWW